MTPDEHVQELVKLADHFESAVRHWKRDGLSEKHGIAALYARRAAAIRWVLALNAFGVAPDECVL
jgi:hypothetical protein